MQKLYLDSNILKFDSDIYVIDPSFFLTLFEQKIDAKALDDLPFYISHTLDRLILKAKENKEYQEFLWKFLNYFSYSRTKDKNIYNVNKQKVFFENYELMREKIKTIHIEDIDMELYEFCLKTFKGNSFDISMSPKINFLANVLGEIIGFSKKKHAIIAMKTRRFVNLFREKILSLELPKKIIEESDFIIDKKKDLSGKIFDFTGGKSIKFFVGMVISIAGYEFSSPEVGILSILLVFIDP